MLDRIQIQQTIHMLLDRIQIQQTIQHSIFHTLYYTQCLCDYVEDIIPHSIFF